MLQRRVRGRRWDIEAVDIAAGCHHTKQRRPFRLRAARAERKEREPKPERAPHATNLRSTAFA
jgi:hypothetical protein